jgi:hypothetical protein
MERAAFGKSIDEEKKKFNCDGMRKIIIVQGAPDKFDIFSLKLSFETAGSFPPIMYILCPGGCLIYSVLQKIQSCTIFHGPLGLLTWRYFCIGWDPGRGPLSN